MDWVDLWHPTERQIEAHQAVKKYKFILYGGAMGGGKSYFLRWELLYILMTLFDKYKIKGLVVGLFCEDYPALKDRQLNKIKYEFPEELGSHHSDHKEYGNCFLLRGSYGAGVIVFRNLDDPSKYRSAEFAAIAIDELTQNDKDVFDFLRTRLRWPGIDEVKFIAGSNPGGIGHGWVKKIWFDKLFEEGEEEQEQFYFVPAKAKDNPHLQRSYYKSLSGLPVDLRKAYLEGNWDVFAGQFFQEWDRNIHIVPVPTGFSREIIGIDYGYGSGEAAIGWFKILVDGKLVLYKELYVKGRSYSALAKEIIAMTPNTENLNYPDYVDYIVSDPAIWNDRAHHKESLIGESGAETMQRIFNEAWGVSRIVLMQGDNNRVPGWGQFRERLKPYINQHKEMDAMFGVTENCPNFIRTVPSLIFNKNKPEDVSCNVGEDHMAAMARYVFMSRPIAPEAPKEPKQLSRSEKFHKKIREQIMQPKEPRIIGT